MPGRSRQTFGVLAVAGSLGLLLLLPWPAAPPVQAQAPPSRRSPSVPTTPQEGDLSTALTELKIRAGLLEHLKLDALGIGIDVAERHRDPHR